MKASEWKNLQVDEIQEKVNALKKELMQLRFQAKTGKLEKQSQIKQTKKEVARALTVLNEKKCEENEVHS